MLDLIVFLAIMFAILGGFGNKKWYTKLAAVVGGVGVAAPLLIYMLLFPK